MITTAEQIRAYNGPAILSYGFRPFFLSAGIWAMLTVALWLPMLEGHLVLPTAFSPIEWHIHELLYGYVPAVVAGFLLTAVPNWTGRLPVVGAPLLALFVCWLAGRVAVATSELIGSWLSGAVDLVFLLVLGAVVAREIIAGKNTNNLKVLAVISLFCAGNAAFHFEAAQAAGTGYGMRIGIAAVITLIMLIGGRITPSFTRNWLARRPEGRMPVPFNRFDAIIIVGSIAALAAWTIEPQHGAATALLILACLLNSARLVRWAGERTSAEPLLLVLHIAYAFVPLGFALTAVANLAPDIILPSAAVHAWTSGAIGLMTLAVMSRATLGHTGRPLTASGPIVLIFIAAFLAAASRIGAGTLLSYSRELTTASALLWVVAFGGFVACFARLLIRSRR